MNLLGQALDLAMELKVPIKIETGQEFDCLWLSTPIPGLEDVIFINSFQAGSALLPELWRVKLHRAEQANKEREAKVSAGSWLDP